MAVKTEDERGTCVQDIFSPTSLNYLRSSIVSLQTKTHRSNESSDEHDAIVNNLVFSLGYFNSIDVIQHPGPLTIESNLTRIGDCAYRAWLRALLETANIQNNDWQHVALALAQYNLVKAGVQYQETRMSPQSYLPKALPFFYPEELLAHMRPLSHFSDKLQSIQIDSTNGNSNVWDELVSQAETINAMHESVAAVSLARQWHEEISPYLPIGRYLNRVVTLDDARVCPDRHLLIIQQFAVEQGYIPLPSGI